jgi:3,4-dihydroxy 2-butanone 4-phosphate synthase/GTP cyclohydrolase II
MLNELNSRTGRVSSALAALRAGRPIVLVDDAQGYGIGGIGHLVFAAERATASLVAFTVRHTTGYLRVALPLDECERLGLPPMRTGEPAGGCSAQRVTVDLIGTGTGISASARARTIAALAAQRSGREDFRRPGHVIPLLALDGGVMSRVAPTEAALDLARLAGLRPAAAMCEVVSVADPGQLAEAAGAAEFARMHQLELVTVSDIVEYRRAIEPQVVAMAAANLPTAHGDFRAVGYRGTYDEDEHIALVAGDVDDGIPVPVHLHSECLAGDVLGSLACSCAAALAAAVDEIGAHGRGVIVYSRSRRARACGILGRLGSAAAAPSGAPAVLRELGVRSVRLVGCTEEQRLHLERAGVRVSVAAPLVAAS